MIEGYLFSNNHIRKRSQGTVLWCKKTVSKVDTALEGKNEKKRNEPENSEHSTCHSEWNDTTCTVVNVQWNKNWLCQKGITWCAVTGVCMQQKRAKCCISRSLSDVRDTDISTVSQHSPKKRVLSEMKFRIGRINVQP